MATQDQGERVSEEISYRAFYDGLLRAILNMCSLRTGTNASSG